VIELTIPDMHCDGCIRSITQAVQGVDPAARVETDLATHAVRIDSTQPAALFSVAIDEAGFTVA
jgi:copper chaperone